MATIDDGGAADADAISDAAATLRGAGFVHLVAHADGDAVAAAGLLGRALGTEGTPFQVSVARTDDEAVRRVADSDETTTCLSVGLPAAGDSTPLTEARPASPVAFETARALEDSSARSGLDPALALAGVAAAGYSPDGEHAGPAVDAARADGVERRPGVAVPTADLADGLAHSTLFHARLSGDGNAAGAALAELGLPAELDADAHRTVASLVAMDATADAPRRAVDAVERALRPLAPAAPFETVGGYADVLDTVVRVSPGTAAALALGHDVRTAALDVWRETARTVHETVRAADQRRYSGLVVADVGDAPTWPLARLLREFRSPEPAVLALGEGEATLSTTDADAGDALANASRAAGLTAEHTTGTETLAFGRLGPDVDGDALADAVREAL